MKALVTGDAGFVGRHFSKFLKERDWDVYGMDIANGPDEDVIPYFLEDDEEHFDLVVHCAFNIGGRATINSSKTNLMKNLTIDSLMFDWALKGGASAVLYFSSSAAYPIKHQSKEFNQRLSEGLIYLDEMEMPDADYGWAKLNGERLARNARESGLRVHVLRPFSGYGADQEFAYPFPSIVKRAMEGTLEVWGPPGQTRDWVHIDDVVEGAFEAYLQNVETTNICTGIGTEMGDLIKLAYLMSHDSKPSEVTYLEDKPYGVFSRVGDPKKFFNIYEPKITLAEGIQEAIDRFRE